MTRTFRVFVSSTFEDLKVERNALQERVFPRLREVCAARGARFQAIDLRWGVSREAALDHQAIAICLREIARCQAITPRPNFIALLGDRYGWRPLPAAIPAEKFARIRVALVAAPEVALLDEWYGRWLDANSIPPVFRLQPRSGAHLDEARWAAVEHELRRALTWATRDFTTDSRVKYGSSATEQEIEAGLLGPADTLQHAFAFLRTIRRLPSDSSAREYLDLDPHGRPDHDAQVRITQLRDRLSDRLGRNAHRYDAQWLVNSRSDVDSHPISLDHLTPLCDDVYRCLEEVILQQIEVAERGDPLNDELDSHQRFARDRARHFVGRSSAIEQIDNYLRSEGGGTPLVVSGVAGSGKSALLARVGSLATDVRPNAFVIARFIGTTPRSSSGWELLTDLCRQIDRAYGAASEPLDASFAGLVEAVQRRLARASEARPLIIVYDALDQLRVGDPARNLAWLPDVLPRSAYVILSTAVEDSPEVLSTSTPADRDVVIGPLSTAEGAELLEHWLADANRSLTDEQRAAVLEAFSACGFPLYLRLVFDEARRWSSYDAVPALSATVEGMLTALFDRLSEPANHGRALVERSFAYLAAAKNGLSEDELLDLLAADTDYFSDFLAHSHHALPTEPGTDRRLPVVVWSRLHFDVETYLTERRADGASLMDFYHRQFRTAAERQFLGEQEKPARHRALAAYFGAQPLFPGKTNVANARKLAELPYQQTHAGMWRELRETMTRDFEFLEAKCRAAPSTSATGDRITYGGVYELQEDFRRALAVGAMAPSGTAPRR